MARTYEVEVAAICKHPAMTGRALTVRGMVRGSPAQWEIQCDTAGRPLAIRRNGQPYPTLATCLRPMHRFAVRFLAGVKVT